MNNLRVEPASNEAPSNAGGLPESCDIWEAAALGYNTTISYLIQRGVNIDATDAGGFTAIMKAAACGEDDTVSHLIASGADVNFQSTDMNLKVTALHCAAITGQPSCVESLIRAGADTRLRDGASDTALEWARRQNFEQSVWLLENAHAIRAQAVVGQREMAAATGRAYSTAAVRAAVRAGLERAEAEQAAEDAWVVAEEC